MVAWTIMAIIAVVRITVPVQVGGCFLTSISLLAHNGYPFLPLFLSTLFPILLGLMVDLYVISLCALKQRYGLPNNSNQMTTIQ